MSALLHDIEQLLAKHPQVSDIQLQEGGPIEYRDALGEMQIFGQGAYHADELAQLVATSEITNGDKLAGYLKQKNGDIDEVVIVDGMRFRANVYLHGGEQLLAASLRPIRSTIPSMKELGIDQSIQEWLNHRAGLILVTGPSGSGKTTTLAAMVNYINQTRRDHILMIEDPIEYEHTRLLSSIRQREVGRDTESFDIGIRAGLRQNPNVIVVGEIRDRATMEVVLSASETGHLVLATLHSTSAPRAPERVVDFFPEEVKALARSQLSSSLIGVLTQVLVPKADRSGKALATEAMANLGDVIPLIREGKFAQLSQSVAQPGTRPNTWLLNTRLESMVVQGTITHDTAIDAAYDREDIRNRLYGPEEAKKEPSERKAA